MAGGRFVAGGVHGRGLAWQGGVCGGGGCVAGEGVWQGGRGAGMTGGWGVHSGGGVPRIRSTSGRYPSYWNAFL